MNTGTILRTVLITATCINTALMSIDLTGFANEKLNFMYKVASIICMFVITAITTYFNNDYSVEAMVGTSMTRDLKEITNKKIDIEDEPEDSEIEEDDREVEEW